ncbi:hypothetical protein MsAg5_07650 [Methanosarcinaceae archaeon Ag5]|uniref:GLUG domain-containing protein n=1 Tax=Methanolapillus africanus TaxID=3028297 RepID=A0AAE4SCW1_9EURY|nr:hypothetical protein [Methanosarcinaceae archaeon Ag5]
MDEQQKKRLTYGAIALAILMLALLILAGVYYGKDPIPPNESAPPQVPVQSGSGLVVNGSGEGTGLGSGSNTIYANQEIGGRSSSAATGIYTIEDLYNVRNNLAGSYILMNDLDFNNESHYDFSSPDAWNYVALNLLELYPGMFEGNSLDTLTDNDWAKIKEVQPDTSTGEYLYGYRYGYMAFFQDEWTPIGSADWSEIFAGELDRSDLEIALNDVFNKAFTGSFNGNEKTIFFDGYDGAVRPSEPAVTAVKKDLPSENYGRGLFGIIGKTGSVSNTTIFISENGGVFGIGNLANINLGTISSCHVMSHGMDCIAVSASKMEPSSIAFGGLAGINSGTIQNSSFNGFMRSDVGSGGIAGVNVNGGDWYDETDLFEVENNNNFIDILLSDGYLTGPATIQQCSVNNSDISGGMAVGGIAGLNAGGIIKQSSVSDTYVGGEKMVGGIVGLSYYGAITDCYYRVWKSETGIYGSAHVGGIAGWIYNATVSNSYFTGYVYGDESNVGGIVGRVEGGESYVRNNVVADSYIELDSYWTENKNVGRIIGFIKGNDAKDNYNDEPEQNYAYEGVVIDCTDPSENYDGIDIKLGDLYQESTYTTAVTDQWTPWDFNGIWKMDEGLYGLPIFKGQESSLSDYWAGNSGTLMVDGESVDIDSLSISLWPSGYAEIHADETYFYGSWEYDQSTSEQDDIILSHWSGFTITAHLDGKGNLILDDFDSEISGTEINASDIQLKEIPPNEDVWWYWEEIIVFDATVDEAGTISEENITNLSLELGPDTYFIYLEVDSDGYEFGGDWQVNDETRLLGDYFFTIDDDEYNARIVRGINWNYYLIIETDDFRVNAGEVPVVVNELVISGYWD